MNTRLKGLYPITPPNFTSDKDYLEKCYLVINSGINIFQFRAPNFSSRQKKYFLNEIYAYCLKANVQLIINNDLDLVKKYDEAGLHIGKSDITLKEARKKLGEEKIIGFSCGSDVLDMERLNYSNNLSYLSIGAMFHTSTKRNVSMLNEKTIMFYMKNKLIPVCIIGGIDKHTISDVIKFNPDMVAISNGIFGEDMDNITDIMMYLIKSINDKK